MQNVVRTVAWAVLVIAAIVVIGLFIHFLLEVALFAALVAFAYYWFTRALAARRDNRPWR